MTDPVDIEDATPWTMSRGPRTPTDFEDATHWADPEDATLRPITKPRAS